MKHDNLGDRIIIDLSHPKDVLSLFLKINEKSTAANNTLTDSVVLTVRDVSDYAPSSTLFIAKQRMHSNFKSLLSFILYRKKVILMNESDERIVGEDSVWVLKSIHEPVLVTHLPELDSFCTSTMINSIPVYAKFKRRIFNSIAEICTSLTTHNLLMFKDVFENSEAGQGLGVLPFTQILFHAFIILYPKLETLNESRYFVALLQELFHHIDFNSNGYVSWTEFCDFCLKFSFLSTSRHQADDSTSGKDLNDMLIEYEEDILARDTVLPAINVIAFFYHPETDRIALVQERSQDIHIFHASTFNLHTKCLPQEIRDERNEVIVNARKQNKLMLSQKQLRILVVHFICW